MLNISQVLTLHGRVFFFLDVCIKWRMHKETLVRTWKRIQWCKKAGHTARIHIFIAWCTSAPRLSLQLSLLSCWKFFPPWIFFFSFPFPCFCGLQIGQQPRGLHYKQQIKGLPLIRCQGQKGALPVLAMIQYLLICCASGWKEISSLTEKVQMNIRTREWKREGVRWSWI